METPSMHIAMYPWFGMGHLTPFLHTSNKLAKRGHKISFFVPKKTQSKLEQFNLHPHLITFIPINVPHIDGLPHGAETTSDVPPSLRTLLMTAMDRTRDDIEHLLVQLQPQIVFFDLAYWLPSLASRLGIKSFLYLVVSPATISYTTTPERMQQSLSLTEVDLMKPPPGYPLSTIKVYPFEAMLFASMRKMEYGSGVLFHDRVFNCLSNSDAIVFKGCKEIEGPFVDFLQEKFGKPVLLSGPVLPEPPNTVLEENWASWLEKFDEGTVIYCALGSENILPHDQLLELLLGLELTGLPFLAALKPPIGFETIEDALPEGFKERVQGKGIVHGGWVQQQLILGHPSVGCHVTHCGAGSMIESLINKCQIVLLPQLNGDQIIIAKVFGGNGNLKVGVEVEKGAKDGFFTKESVCKAVKIVMDDENELGREVRANRTKIRNLLLSKDFESACVDSFCHKLQDLLK